MDRSADDSDAFEEDSGSEWSMSDQESSDSSDFSETSDIESDDEGAQQDENQVQPAVQPWLRVYPPETTDNTTHQFLEDAGPKHMPARDATPLMYFLLFFTDGLLNLMVTETNRYARQFRDATQGTLKRFSRFHRWTDTTNIEMKAFIAIVINMGLNQRPLLQSYWSRKDSQHISWFPRVMSYNRFTLLLKCFSIMNRRNLVPNGQPGYDPTARFRPLVDHCNQLFKRFYTPKQDLSVDESLIGTKNKTELLQYMPKKHHHKWGIKLWMLCESASGYVLSFNVYRGRRGNAPEAGLSYQVVMDLMTMSNYLNKAYHVFCDNYFTGVQLASDLFGLGTYLTCTLRRN